MPSDGEDSSGDEVGEMHVNIFPGPHEAQVRVNPRIGPEHMVVPAGHGDPMQQQVPQPQAAHPGKAPPPMNVLLQPHVVGVAPVHGVPPGAWRPHGVQYKHAPMAPPAVLAAPPVVVPVKAAPMQPHEEAAAQAAQHAAG